MESSNDNGNRRRAGLRALLARKGISPTTLSKQISLPTASVLFNFLNGHSNSLSLEVIERILALHPDVTFSELVGCGERHRYGVNDGVRGIGSPANVAVSVEADPTRWRNQFELLPMDWGWIVPPRHFQNASADLFGVRVCAQGQENLYADGSLLLCRRLAEGDANLASGMRYIVQHRHNRAYCATVQELAFWNDEPWLCPRSSNPRCSAPTMLATCLAQMSSGHDGDKVCIKGLVIASWQTEKTSTHV